MSAFGVAPSLLARAEEVIE